MAVNSAFIARQSKAALALTDVNGEPGKLSSTYSFLTTGSAIWLCMRRNSGFLFGEAGTSSLSLFVPSTSSSSASPCGLFKSGPECVFRISSALLTRATDCVDSAAASEAFEFCNITGKEVRTELATLRLLAHSPSALPAP